MKANGYDYNDLKAVGVDGFLRAIEKYRSNGGASFHNYAIHWIKARIHKFMLQNQTIIRTPEGVGFASDKFVDNELIDLAVSELRNDEMNLEQLEIDKLLDIA